MIALLKALAEALKEPLTAFGRWLNPDRKREAIKDRAIESAGELMAIKDEMLARTVGVFKETRRCSGKYAKVEPARLLLLEIHFNKQWAEWRDGTA